MPRELDIKVACGGKSNAFLSQTLSGCRKLESGDRDRKILMEGEDSLFLPDKIWIEYPRRNGENICCYLVQKKTGHGRCV